MMATVVIDDLSFTMPCKGISRIVQEYVDGRDCYCLASEYGKMYHVTVSGDLVTCSCGVAGCQHIEAIERATEKAEDVRDMEDAGCGDDWQAYLASM